MKAYKDYKTVAISASNGQWETCDFTGYDVVIHLSGIVHRKEKEVKELYDKVNYQLAVKVAQKAKKAGVKQFIFMSTAAVFGDHDKKITKETHTLPDTLYAKSKLKAEKQIQKLDCEKFNIVILRPPMVYGKNCPGNFTRLKGLAKIAIIFPKVNNKRSMIYIGNLCELMRLLIDQEARGIYHPQNSEYVCTSHMVKIIRKNMNIPTFCIGGFQNIIKMMAIKSSSLRKIFGDWTYDMDLSDIKDITYQITSFEESIRESL